MEEVSNKFSVIHDSTTSNHKIFINFLNDDCLMHIFQFLSIADRVRIERVCRRWQRVSKESWHSYKSLSLYSETWGLTSCNQVKMVKNPHVFYKVLKRCGRYLKYLEFAGYIDDLIDVGCHIGSLCPNLQHLELAGVTKTVLKNIAENCTNIKSFHLRDTIDSCDDELSLLFSRNKKLQILEFISECKNPEAKFWLDVPAESMQTLSILNSTLSSSYFYEAVRKMKNLSKLTFDFCDDLNDESMQAICSLTALKEIQTGAYSGYITSLNPLVNLRNLKVVEFSWSDYVDDEFLIELSRNCRELSDVDISGCSRVSNVGVASVTLLPKLERLILNYLIPITARAFNSMRELKEIECFMCKNISTRCFSRIIETSEHLELLNVCYCKVYNSTVRRAIIATKKRTNNMTLRMYVYGTPIKLEKIMDVSPYLNLIFAYRLHNAKNYA